jgi:repressor LexA
MSAMAITRRQRQVYDFISDFVQKNGYSPSFEEIGEGLGLSSLATVHKHISNLEKKALLTRDYNRSRSIDLLPPKGPFEAGHEREYHHGTAASGPDRSGSADRSCRES